MSRVRVKICGLRSAEAIDAAVAAGADALGFNFYPPSPRCLDVAAAVELATRVPLWVSRVALFVDESPERMREVAAAIGADTVQVHGDITPERCAALAGLRIIAALPAVAGQTVARIEPLADVIDAVLLDAAVPGEHGGTGRRADWREATAVREAFPRLPLILAGGLRPGNVAQAIGAVRPYAVDVASGVESAPGVKDTAAMEAFVAAVRRTEA